MFHILILGLGALSGGAKPTKAFPWRRDWIRLNCQLVTKLEMMYILQAQVWSCISAHPGLPHQKTKRETSDASKSQLNQANWNRTVSKFGSNQLNGHNDFSILFLWFSLDSIISYQFNWVCTAHLEYRSLVLRSARITGVWVRKN